MPTVVQFRRGTTAQNDAFTGAVGELSVDTQKDTVRVHDGSTAGGFELLQRNLTNQTIGGSIIPDTDSAYDLGSPTNKWRSLYISGQTIYIGDATISASGSTVVLPSGSTIEGAGSLLDSASARQAFSVTDAGGDGSMTYNPANGVFTYTGPSDAEVRAHFSGGTGVGITDGVVSIGQDVATTADVTFATVETTGNVTVGGNLTVNGTTTTLNTSTLDVEDLNITVAKGAADSASANGAGITVDGSGAYIVYDATGDTWNVNKPLGAGFNAIQNYSTTQLTEGDNLYYTTARVNTDFDTRLATKSTSDVSEGSNLYYTTARADSDFDVRLATKTTTNVAEGDNLYYTRARVDSALGDSISQATIRGYFSAAGDLSYNSSTGEFSFDVENVYTQANFDSDFNTSLDAAAIGGVGLAYNSTTNTLSIDSAELAAYFSTDNITEGTNLYYTTARVNTDFDTRLATKSTSDVAEGTNLYYTTARADSDAKAAITGGTGITYSSGTISTNDGEIVHDNLSGYVADEHIAHSTVSITAGSGLTGGGTIASTRTLNIGQGTGITVGADAISTNDAQIVHDNLSGYVADEHIAHSGVTITAGSGLTGGGTIAASRTLNIGQGTGITVSADAISTNDGEIVHDNLSGFVANEHIDHTSVTITAGSGLTGGGDISANRTLNIGAGTGIAVNADDVAIDSAGLYANFAHNDFHDYVGDEHVAHSGVTITAGAGLTGGGTIAASRTLNIGQGTGITVGADAISTNDGEIVHDNLSGFVANEHIDHSTVSITAGSGLTGGGTIAATRTLNIGQGTGITVGADAISTNDAQIVHDNLSGFVADEHVAHSGVTMTAGNGLTGGGTIAASRTFNVGAGTGVTVSADAVSIGQDVATTADVTFATVTTTGNIVVGGNLQVTGTTTTVNSQTLEVTDNMIYMNAGESDGSPTQSIDVGWAANVNDGGSYTHVGMFRDATDDRFKVFGAYTPEPDAALEINTGHASFALADFQAANFYGDLTGDVTGNVTGNASTATTLQTARTIGLTGDVTATGVSFDGSGNISLTTAMAANSVDLGTHTTGNYVAAGATSGNGISGSVSSEGGTFTVTSNATNANTGSTIVFRDASGNFSAGTITAALSGNASTATKWATGRTIALTGDVTGTSGSFDGSGNLSFATTVAANVIGANELNVTGNGTTGQFLRSDGDGTFTWATPTDTNTTYSAGNGISLSGTTFSVAAGTGLTQDASGLSISNGGVSSTQLASATSLVIYNSAGTALKTLYGAGS